MINNLLTILAIIASGILAFYGFQGELSSVVGGGGWLAVCILNIIMFLKS